MAKAIGQSRHLVTHWRQQKDEAADFVAQLLALPSAHQELKISNLRRAHQRAVCDLLLSHSRERRHDDPHEALRLAKLATLVAERLDPATCGETRARAWADLGNLWRICGDHVEARRALGKARRIFDREGSDPLTGAEIDSLVASFERCEDRPERAIELLERAVRVQARFANLEGTARALLQLAALYSEQGDIDRAFRSSVAALDLSEDLGDRRLKFIALEGLIYYTAQMGRTQEALSLAQRALPVYRLGAPALDHLRMIWTVARFQVEVEDHRAAATTLQDLKQEFLAADLPYEVALVGLDLAVCWAALGDRSQLRREAAETTQLLTQLGVERESLAAAKLWSQAELQEVTASTALLATALEKARQIDGRSP